jgi:hypothetical protein
VGLFDWVRGGRPRVTLETISTWRIAREHGALVVDFSPDRAVRLPLEGVGAVRIVPLTGGQHHLLPTTGGWQVSLQRPDGDLLVGDPMADWRVAQALAQRVCDATGLPLDELSRRLFSRVGTSSPVHTPEL